MNDVRETEEPMDDDEPVPVPIDGVLDLHAFSPRDVKDLVPDWIDACRDAGFTEVRIVHGRGVGVLRRTVHALLSRHPDVLSFELAPPTAGGWGATLARLRPKG